MLKKEMDSEIKATDKQYSTPPTIWIFWKLTFFFACQEYLDKSVPHLSKTMLRAWSAWSVIKFNKAKRA